MRVVRRLFFIVLLVLVGGGVFLTFYMPDWKSTLKFIPPKWASHDCSTIKTEIEKYDWDTEIATAIMKAESSCDAEARGDEDLTFTENGRDYGYSVGAFQIRILPGRESCDSYDIKTNVKCAYDIYKQKNNFSDWSMYKNGSYKQYLWRTVDELMMKIPQA